MRAIGAMLLAGVTGAVLWAGQNTAVEVKGPHICCNQCKVIVSKILNAVPGVSDVKPDQTNQSVSFSAKDAAAAKAGFKAIVDGGFFGTATAGGKEIKLDLPAVPKGDKAAVVAVKNVHVCCGACRKAIDKVFKDAKVSYEGKGPQLTVKVEGSGLDNAGVVGALQKAGFYGTVEK